MAGSTSARNATSGLLKVVFLVHLVLSAWGMESNYLVPTGYLYYNLIFMISLIWAVSSDKNMDSASMAFLVTLACIGMDAFALSLWPKGGPSRERVYFGLAIANAVLRAVTAILLYRLFRDRDSEGVGLKGTFGDITGILNYEGAGGRKGYEDIEGQQGPSSQSQTPQAQPQPTQDQRGGGNARGIAPELPTYYFNNDI